MPLQRKTAKTPRRYLTGICVFPSQRHLRHLQNQPSTYEGGLSWVDERNSSTIPASHSMKSRRSRAAFSRTSSLSMRVKKDNESSQNGSGSGSAKTIKTAAATRLPNDSKARNNGSRCRYSKYAERDGVLPSLSAYYQRSKGLYSVTFLRYTFRSQFSIKSAYPTGSL